MHVIRSLWIGCPKIDHAIFHQLLNFKTWFQLQEIVATDEQFLKMSLIFDGLHKKIFYFLIKHFLPKYFLFLKHIFTDISQFKKLLTHISILKNSNYSNIHIKSATREVIDINDSPKFWNSLDWDMSYSFAEIYLDIQ